jgi:integrase
VECWQKVWILLKFGFRNKSKLSDLFRRTRACGLYQDGVAMEQVAALLGHSNIETTRTHYARPSKEQMQESMKKGMDKEPEKKEWVGNTDEIKRKFGLL